MKNTKCRRIRRSYTPAVRANVPRWFAREGAMERGTQTVDYYQSDPREVHILGSLAPQTTDSLFVSFTGDWSWADGSRIMSRLRFSPWDSVFPADVRIVILYAVGDHAFPSSYVFAPTAYFVRPTEVVCAEMDMPDLFGSPCMERSWLEGVNWEPCATVSGKEFMQKGFSAFYPELTSWSRSQE